MRHLLIAAAALATLAACTPDTGTQTANPTPTPKATASPANSTAAMAATVEIKDFKFVPATVTIKKGGTVTWVNMDEAPHNANPTGGVTFTKTEDLAKGESGSATFGATGTADYNCSIHPNMTGKVVVVD